MKAGTGLNRIVVSGTTGEKYDKCRLGERSRTFFFESIVCLRYRGICGDFQWRIFRLCTSFRIDWLYRTRGQRVELSASCLGFFYRILNRSFEHTNIIGLVAPPLQ